MDFVLHVDDQELVFAQFHDLVAYIEQYLAQWNNFDPARTPILMIHKRPNNIPTLGINTIDGVDVSDIFGGLPESWNDDQKELYLKVTKMAETHGEAAARDYIRSQSKR